MPPTTCEVALKTSMNARAALSLATSLVAASLLVGCGSAPPTSTSTDGKALVAELCGECHPVERVAGVKKDRAGWTTTVARMRQNGLDVTDEQAAAIVGYLTQRDGGQ
jgi:mono/diheme cytochrome c family protein